MISKRYIYISGNNWGSCWGSGKMLKGCFASIHIENISVTNFWGCFSHVRRTLADYHKWDIEIMIWKLNVKVVSLQFHFCWWRSPSNFMNRRSVANLRILLRKVSYFRKYIQKKFSFHSFANATLFSGICSGYTQFWLVSGNFSLLQMN